MFNFMESEQQEKVKNMVKELIKKSQFMVEFNIEITGYTNDKIDITYRLWIGYLRKNYRFETIEEMFNSFEPMLHQIQSKKIEEKYLDKYECQRGE